MDNARQARRINTRTQSAGLVGWKQARRLALAELTGVRPPGLRWTPARIGHALGLDLNGHDDGMARKWAWKQEIVAWARSRQSEKTTSPHTDDAFDLSDPYDQYLHSLMARDVVRSSTTEETVVVEAVRESDRDARSTRTDSPSHIAGRSITGKDYSPTMCPECETNMPWEPQCDACTAAFEGRRAVVRAEAGVVGPTATAEAARVGLQNTNSFDDFMARQLSLLIEPLD